MKIFSGWHRAIGVVLAWTVLSVFGDTKTWTGKAGALWSDRGNWAENNVPENGDQLLFPAGTGSVTSNNMAGLSLSGISFSASSAFELGGDAFVLASGGSGILCEATAKIRISAPFGIEGKQTFSVNNVNEDFEITSEISGSGSIFKIGYGNLLLRTNNTFSGGIEVTNGWLKIYAPSALGAADAKTLISRSFSYNKSQMSRMEITGSFTVPNPLSFQGESANAGVLNVNNGVTLGGSIEIGGQMRWFLGNNQIVHVSGGVTRQGSGGLFINNVAPSSQLIFDGTPINLPGMQIYSDGSGTMAYNCSGNFWSSMVIYNGVQRMGAPNALPPTSFIEFGASNGRLDLGGYDQTIKYLTDRTTAYAPTHYVTSSVPALLTLNANRDCHFGGCFIGGAGLCWNPTYHSTFCFSNGVSDTTGSLIVSNGTLCIKSGASFPRLTSLSVSDGATCSIEESSQMNPYLELDLDTTAALELVGGAFTFKTVRVNGAALPPGKYSSTPGVNEMACAQLSGTGTFYIPAGPVPAVFATWDAGGGLSDTAFSTPANWEGDVLPDFVTGGLVASFASSGLTATVTDSVRLGTLRFNSTNEMFTLTSGNEKARLTMFAGGIHVEQTAKTAQTRVVDVPMLLNDAQTWNVEKNFSQQSDLTLPNQIDSSYKAPICKTGIGNLNLCGTNSFTGDFVISNGSVHVYSDFALGHTNGITIVDNSAKSPDLKLWFCGVTTEEPFRWIGGDREVIYALDHTTNVFNGPIVTIGSNVRMRANEGAQFVFAGGVQADALFLPYGGSFIITNKPFNGKLYIDGTAKVTLAATNNNLFSDSLVSAQGGVLCTAVDHAFSPYSSFRIGVGYAPGGTFDLDGHDQTVQYIIGTTDHATVRPFIRSAAPATLTFTSGNTSLNAVFSGAVSFNRSGAGTISLTSASTTEGALLVTGGQVTFTSTGSWLNGTNVVVSSGTLLLKHGQVFNKDTVVTLSETGKMSLDAGVDQRVLCLYIDGVKSAAGTYGATGSGADIIDNTHFAGTGILTVTGDYGGTVFLLR